MKQKVFFLIAISFASMLIGSCKKEAGEGGNSSITGTVHTTKCNGTFTFYQGEFLGADEDVYIIYGDDITYGDRIKSGPDGKFEFKYLREGSYKIYVYSDDTVNVTPIVLIGKVPVYKEVDITSKKQTVDCGTLEIKKNN